MSERLKFSLMHLDKYLIIKGPCSSYVKCLSTLKYDTFYIKDGNNRWLVKLGVIVESNLEVIKIIMAANKKSGLSTYYDDVQHLFTTGAIWEDQIYSQEDLPLKGEYLGASFDFVEGILRCTHITVITRKKPEQYNPAIDMMKELEELDLIIQKNGQDEI